MRGDFVNPILVWYNQQKRDLPWRHTKDPYKIWVSEIMLQQTRVEAVKSYYQRFLETLPDIPALAGCPDDLLLKLWEGLGYYSRVRNMKKAALTMMETYGGSFPTSYDKIRSLPGIGDYTAGAISSIAFSLREAAVDGNVMRVMARLENSREDILKASEKRRVAQKLKAVMEAVPPDQDFRPGDFNQALIELGALICVPNSQPLCQRCPLKELCISHREETTDAVPVRLKKTGRKKEERTVLLVRDGDKTAIIRRPDTGLLAGLYEFPNLAGRLDEETVLGEVRSQGLIPLRIKKIREARHIFSHVEWEMSGYEIRVAPAEANGDWIFADQHQIEKTYAIPSAFSAYAELLSVRTGKKGKKS